MCAPEPAFCAPPTPRSEAVDFRRCADGVRHDGQPARIVVGALESAVVRRGRTVAGCRLLPNRGSQFRSGKLQQTLWHGLLAYRDGELVGWCSLAPRCDFGYLRKTTRSGRDEGDAVMWAVSCLVSRAGFRVVHVRLLRRAIVRCEFEEGPEVCGRRSADCEAV